MKRKRRILSLGIGIVIISIGVKFAPQIKVIICNIQNPKLFSRDTTVIKRNDFDEVWDFKNKAKPSRGGDYQWTIGTVDGEIMARRVASDSTVAVFYNKQLNMDYKSKEDYWNHGGETAFENFIEKND